MPTGRRPKPTHLKLISGNPGKRPLNRGEPQPRRTRPTPPDFLSTEALTEWKRVAPELHRLGLLTTLDRAVFAVYCQSWGHWITALRAIRGLEAEGKDVPAALRQIARQAVDAMLRCAIEFGMTPSSRSRIRGSATGDPINPFAEFVGL